MSTSRDNFRDSNQISYSAISSGFKGASWIWWDILTGRLCRVVFRSPYSNQPFWGPLAGYFLWGSLVCAFLSYCAVHVDSPEDGRYWSTKIETCVLDRSVFVCD